MNETTTLACRGEGRGIAPADLQGGERRGIAPAGMQGSEEGDGSN